MKRSLRADIASAAAGIFPPSFGAFLWLFEGYAGSRPTHSDPDNGFVNVLNNHGAYVYISNAESTGLYLLMAAALLSILAAAIIVPKEGILPPPGTPKWVTYLSARAKTDLSHPNRRQTFLFLCAAGSWLAVIWLFGSSIARFVVSHGVVLRL